MGGRLARGHSAIGLFPLQRAPHAARCRSATVPQMQMQMQMQRLTQSRCWSVSASTTATATTRATATAKWLRPRQASLSARLAGEHGSRLTLLAWRLSPMGAVTPHWPPGQLGGNGVRRVDW